MNRNNPDRDLVKQLADETVYLRRFARSLVGDPASADDLVQDTLERAIKRLHLFDRSRELRPWLYRILRNLNINQYRQAQSRGQHLGLDLVAESAIASAPLQDSALVARDISQALDMLPYEHREVLVLIALEGLKYREVVDVLSIPIGTVMSRLFRARERLRELLHYPENTKLRRVK